MMNDAMVVCLKTPVRLPAALPLEAGGDCTVYTSTLLHGMAVFLKLTVQTEFARTVRNNTMTFELHSFACICLGVFRPVDVL